MYKINISMNKRIINVCKTDLLIIKKKSKIKSEVYIMTDNCIWFYTMYISLSVKLIELLNKYMQQL